MTDAEIIKALECFAIDKDSDETYCVGCAFETKGLCCENCSEGIAKASLDLINRQKAEIERLKEPVSLVVNCEVTEDMLKTLRNQKVINLSNDEAEAICLWDKHVRTEAIKEFAERLKKSKHECGCNYRKKPVYAVTEGIIDNLVKEMAGNTE